VRRRFPAALDAVAGEACRFREWARGWIARWQAAPHADHTRDVAHLNQLLAQSSPRRELAIVAGALQLVERDRLESADDLIALLAVQVAKLVAREDPALIKHCAGPGCTLAFLDRTKSHRRVFCSAAACGNRVKVAAYRGRHRS
jgi:predicted RNA-binding Zn ribbon-like protein